MFLFVVEANKEGDPAGVSVFTDSLTPCHQASAIYEASGLDGKTSYDETIQTFHFTIVSKLNCIAH